MPKRKPIDVHAESYGKGLRSSVYGFWRGTFDLWEFIDAMASAIEVHFTRAWQDGASTCGITPEDYTDADQDELRYLINSEIGYVMQFAQDILAGGKGLGKLTPLVQRTAEWQNKYYAVYNTAISRGCGGQRLEWRLGYRKEHCPDCVMLNGRIYTTETWNKYGLAPQSISLSCRGYNCGCVFLPTSAPVTPGHPPMLLGRKSSESSPNKMRELSLDYSRNFVSLREKECDCGRLHA